MTGIASTPSTETVMSTPSTTQNTSSTLPANSSSTSSISRNINLVDVSDDDDINAQPNKRQQHDKSNVSKMVAMLGDMKNAFQVAYAKPKEPEKNIFISVNECIANIIPINLMLINA